MQPDEIERVTINHPGWDEADAVVFTPSPMQGAWTRTIRGKEDFFRAETFLGIVLAAVFSGNTVKVEPK